MFNDLQASTQFTVLIEHIKFSEFLNLLPDLIAISLDLIWSQIYKNYLNDQKSHLKATLGNNLVRFDQTLIDNQLTWFNILFQQLVIFKNLESNKPEKVSLEIFILNVE